MATRAARTSYMNMNIDSAYVNAKFARLCRESSSKISQEENIFVSTPFFQKALDFLLKDKVIVITGPPGSGKTTIGQALLRHCGNQGYTPLVFRSAKDFDLHLKKCVILLDDVFGQAWVDPNAYSDWAQKLKCLVQLISDGQNLFVFVMYRHILKLLNRMPTSAQDFSLQEVPVADLGTEPALPDQHKVEMIRKHTAVRRFYVSDDEASKILASDKSGPLFPWCCKQYAESSDENTRSRDENTRKNDKNDNPYVTIHDGRMKEHCFQYFALAYKPFFFKTLQETSPSFDLIKFFTLIMAGYPPFYRHFEELEEKLKNLGSFHEPHAACSVPKEGLKGHTTNYETPSVEERRAVDLKDHTAKHETISVMQNLSELFQGSILDEDGENFCSRDVYDAFGFTLWENGPVDLLLRECDVKFLVEHVHIEAQDTGPALILTASSAHYYAFLLRVVEEFTAGNLIQISQHPALQNIQVLADLEQLLRRHDLLQTALSTGDLQYGMTLLYWSAWTSSSTLTQWCLKQAEKAETEDMLQLDSTLPDNTKPGRGQLEALKQRTPPAPKSVARTLRPGRERMPLPWELSPEPKGKGLTAGSKTNKHTAVQEKTDLAADSQDQRLAAVKRTPVKKYVVKTEHTASGETTSEPQRSEQTACTSPISFIQSGQFADVLRRTFLACCVLGEKVDVPRVADMFDMLCEDVRVLDDNTSTVVLPIPPSEDVLTDTCSERCQKVRDAVPVPTLGLSRSPQSPGPEPTQSHVSIPSDIVTVKKSEDGERLLVTRQNCSRWYSLLRLMSMCDVNELNRDGYTLLHTAAFNGEFSIVWFLAVSGADLEATSCRGNTPLTKAIDRNQVNVATYILHHGRHGREPNVKDLTRLCGQIKVDDLVRRAIVCKRLDMLRLLLRHGANVKSRDYKGRSLLQLARFVEDHQVIGVLREFGAE